MGHRPPGRAGPAACTAMRRLLWSTGISMETRTCGLMCVFHLGSSHSRSLNRGTWQLQGRALGSRSWGCQVGQTRGASGWGSAGWGSAGWGCGSGFRVGSPPPTRTAEPAGSSSARQHGRAQGKAAPCPGRESHRPIRVPLQLGSAATHPRRSAASLHLVARHGTARHAACLQHLPHPLHLPHGEGPAAIPGWCPQAKPTLPAMCSSSRT